MPLTIKYMSSLTLTIQPRVKQQKVLIEMDATKFERLAAQFGFFSQEFLDSLDQAEKDYRNGRIRKINSLKSLS